MARTLELALHESPTSNICFSGGAQGVDTIFGEIALEFGHTPIHYHFDPKFRKRFAHVILEDDELEYAVPHLKKANKFLGRSIPPSITYSGRLLRRNYFQVTDSSAVYAVAPLTPLHEDDPSSPIFVKGGTAWACAMFLNLSPPDAPLYCWDVITEKWYEYDRVSREWHTVVPSRPKGFYTGIGTRSPSAAATQAIRGLYE